MKNEESEEKIERRMKIQFIDRLTRALFNTPYAGTNHFYCLYIDNKPIETKEEIAEALWSLIGGKP